MFKADSRVRYIGVVDEEYHVLASIQRAGTTSFTSDETTRNFVSIVPQIIVEAVEKLSPFLGEVSGITAHYDKVLMLFYRVGSIIVVLSFEPKVETPFYDKITETFRRISAQYLT